MFDKPKIVVPCVLSKCQEIIKKADRNGVTPPPIYMVVVNTPWGLAGGFCERETFVKAKGIFAEGQNNANAEIDLEYKGQTSGEYINHTFVMVIKDLQPVGNAVARTTAAARDRQPVGS